MFRKRFRFGLAALCLVVSFGLLQSCSIITELLNPNEDPTVSLVADDYSVYSDQVVTFTATASDPDGDSLTYTWKVNGTTVEGTTNKISRYWLNSSTLNPTISVTVDDGNGGSASASVSITVTPGASLRIGNSSSYSIYYIQYRNDTYSSLSADLLGSNVLPPGYVFTFYGFPSNYYQIFLQNSVSTYWYAPSSSTYWIGNGYHFDIRADSNNSTITYWTPSNSPNIVTMRQNTETLLEPLKSELLSGSSCEIIKGPGYTIMPIDMIGPENLSPGRDEMIPFAIK